MNFVVKVLKRHSFVLTAALLFGGSAIGQVITTVAGTDWLFPGDGAAALNAPLGGGFGLGIAVGPNGDYYIADPDNLMVMRVGRDGILQVIAGNGFVGRSGDGGFAVNASLNFPSKVAVDAAGSVYIGTRGSLRKVTPDGIIHTLAGTGNVGFSGDGGPAVRAQVSDIEGIAVDTAGNVYFSDSSNHRIRKITPDGNIQTISGFSAGFSGDNGPAAAARLNTPTDMAFDGRGNLYVVDRLNDRIRRITTDGTISTVAGGGSQRADGVAATQASLTPRGLGLDGAGLLYIADGSNYTIRRVDAGGAIRTIAGSGMTGFSGDGGAATGAALNFVLGAIAVDPAGAVYVADSANLRIRKIENGVIRTVAGNGQHRLSGNGGPAANASVYLPWGLAIDAAGNIYFSEPTLNRVRRITPDGTIGAFAGTGVHAYSGDGGPALNAAFQFPAGLAIDGLGNVFVADLFSHAIRRIDRQGTITTYAGTGSSGSTGDGGPATAATFVQPAGLTFDSAGNLYVADSAAHRVRRITPAGMISTIAGNGRSGFSGDGGAAVSASLNDPAGMCVYDGALYVAEIGNHRIRRISFADGVISTFAGTGEAGYSGDNGAARTARISSPVGIYCHPEGFFYIADRGNRKIRFILPNGNIGTLAGLGQGPLGDGGFASLATLGLPYEVAFDPAGNLVFTDLGFNNLRRILRNPPVFEITPDALGFTIAAGAPPAEQSIQVNGSVPSIFVVAIGTQSWLSVVPSSANTPASLKVRVDAAGLAPGLYTDSVLVVTSVTDPQVRSIPVSLTVTAPGAAQLAVKPAALTFSFVQGAASATRTIAISNAGGGTLPLSISTATRAGNWLSASKADGNLGAFGSENVEIRANPAGLGPGTYSGTVTVIRTPTAGSEAPQRIVAPVLMTITAVQQTILVPQTGLSFLAVEGGGTPLPQNFNILNTGVGMMPWSVSATTLSGGAWLSVFPGNGTTDAASAVVPQVRVTVSPRGLRAGTYFGTIRVSASTADNTPQLLSVVMTVLPPNSRVGPVVQPAGLIFSAASGSMPGSQTVLIQNTGGERLSFSTNRTAEGGQLFFSALPTAGNIGGAETARIVIQPDTSGLAPGIYRGALAVALSDGTSRTVSLVLVITPTGTAATSLKIRGADPACTPSALAPIFTLLADGFSVSPGYPGQVAVSVIDNCARLMTAGNVTVSFSNGDPPQRLVSLKDGTWAGTWTPVRQAAPMVVTADADDPDRKLSGRVRIQGRLGAGTQVPIIGAGAIVNAASFSQQTPVAPGSLVTVFGSELANGAASAGSLPLPTDLQGASILVAGRTAPLVYASNGQVNAVVPFGISVNATHQVVASRGNEISVPQTVTVAAAAPGIFSRNGSGGGQGIILGVDSSGAQEFADTAHPVTAGSTIVIYCTGLGEVSPPVASGTPTPDSPLSTTVNPVTVTIGGVAASVEFAGLTPGFVSLYQVNAMVPQGVAPGNDIPVVISAAGLASPAVTIAVR